MSYALTPEQLEIRDAVARLCERFGDDYWLKKDTDGGFPHEFHQAMAEGGWLGVAMPEEHGGAGLGITEAAVVMQAVAQSGAGFSGASAVHMNIFGLHPVVVFGTAEQQQRWLPPLIAGQQKACFAVTEPDVGLDTTRIKTRALREGNGYVINGRKIWTSTASTSRCARSRRWAATRWTRTRCSSTTCRCPSPTASARKARASSTSCTA